MFVKHLLEAGQEARRNIVTYGHQRVHMYDADGSNGTELEIDGAIKLSDSYVAIVIGEQVQYWFQHVGVDEEGTMVLYHKGPQSTTRSLDALKDILFSQ